MYPKADKEFIRRHIKLSDTNRSYLRSNKTFVNLNQLFAVPLLRQSSVLKEMNTFLNMLILKSEKVGFTEI